MNTKIATLAACCALVVTSATLILAYNNHTEICEMQSAQSRHATGHAIDWNAALDDKAHINGIRTMDQLEAEYPMVCQPADTMGDLISSIMAGIIAFLLVYFPMNFFSRLLIRAHAHSLEH